VLAPRTVTNLLDRYDELRALATADAQRLRPLFQQQRLLVNFGHYPKVEYERIVL
jgi:hypothetical protein